MYEQTGILIPIGIAFSIMGLLPSIASTLAYSLPAGPAGLVWVRRNMVSAVFVQTRTLTNIGLVRCQRIHIHCRARNGGSRVRNAYVRRSVLVDALFRESED